MLLKCLLLKLLQRGDNRGQAIFELDYDKNKTLYSLSLLREVWGELGKETNRKTPRRFLTKTRGDELKWSSLRGDNRGQAIFELDY